MTYPIDNSRRSPNHSPRHGATTRMLVMHATVGGYQSSLNWLCNPASRVSSHYLIRKDGHIAQLVPDEEVAWHAGRSAWLGMGSDAIQLGSIGIELENLAGMELPDKSHHGPDPYPPAQIEAAAWLCRTLINRYHIERAMVVRHLDIAIPKGRKSDPAGFPWQSFVDRLFDVPHDSPPPPPAKPLTAYTVRTTDDRGRVVGGATIRREPKREPRNVVAVLRPNDPWEGEIALGEHVTLEGFAPGNIWVHGPRGYVWLGLLERVKQ